jgi:hypothetical protein
MPTSKEYAYYQKGNKIAIVQKDYTSSGGQTLSQPGLNDLGNIGALYWKSPKESITDGLELQYVYSPQYMLPANSTIGGTIIGAGNKFFINGWTVIGGYLTFLRGIDVGVTNWYTSPENAVISGSSGDTGGQSLDYIVVRGSERWNGLHRVQTAGTDGQLITYTKVNEVLPYWEDVDIDVNTSNEIFDGGGSDNLLLADQFSAGDYIWLSGADLTTSAHGLFKIGSVSTSITDTLSKLTVDTRYVTSYNTQNADLDEEYSPGIAFTADSGMTTVNLYKAYRDFSYILTDVNVLNDEDDELDITRYQANAVTYYVKAKYAEDAGNIEMKEYFMREFRRMVEKHESSKIIGPRILQGYSHFR